MRHRFKKGRIRWVRPFLLVGMEAICGAASARPTLPADVRHVLKRREDCDHWLGEEPYDADRRREIERAVRKLRCDTLERDEARLRRRYVTHPAIIDRLKTD
jgi:hypothetical protein